MKKKSRPAPALRKKKRPSSEINLLSTLSHEVRTPLTSISGYIKLLLGGEPGPLSEVQRDYLSIVDRNVDRLAQLINEILDYQVMESGEIPMNKKVLYLGPVLKECCDTFELLASKKGLKLEFNVPDGLRPVFGDRARLVQIFMNLISNAIKFTQTGSVKVKASEARGGLCVTVEDTGVGLSDLERKKLFKKFFRADSGLVVSEAGTGLGLVITQGLVKSHGGKILVKSKKGNGTVFSVLFPLVLTVTGQERS